MALLLFSLVVGFGANGMAEDTKLDPSNVLKTIVLKPSSYPTGSNSKVSTKHIQMWHRNGEDCPTGTVPIVRSSTVDIPPKNKYDRLRAFNNAAATTNGISVVEGIPHPEFATVYIQTSDYYGLSADINIWNPKVEANEATSSQVWVTDGGGESIEAIEAGWIVRPSMPQPVDGYGESGCYNLDCPGFVQINSTYSLGSQVQPTSTYGGKQYHLNYKIYKDLNTSNWWLKIQDIDIGYWPAELFENLKTSAKILEWGGRVINTNPNGTHTTTQMGSGSLPGEGYSKAAWFRNMEYVDGNGSFNDVTNFGGSPSRPECYDIHVVEWEPDRRVNFFYGGPGYSPTCQ
ncbi:hypothetical protein LINGRAHAP2_LOCUS12286 [Linum grandiflorum]